jgi:hypothetical protein
MTLVDFVSQVRGFYKKSAVDQLLIISWFAEAKEQRVGVDGAYLRQSFRAVGVEPPDMSIYLPRLAGKKPPQIVREKSQFRLAGSVRRELDRQFEGDAIEVAVTKSLKDLPSKIPDLAERAFLSETLACYKAGAFRATTVMAWNLAYDHLTRWATTTDERLAALNDGIRRRLQGRAIVVASHKDLSELTERVVVECCQTGGLIDKNQAEILLEKLKRRNAAAHPSSIVIGQHQANDTISDLVDNVVLSLQ